MANSLNKITTKSILDATVATADIAADAVTGAKIADDAIDSEHYTDGSIDTAHIADNQVTLAKMAGGTDGQIITYDASGDPVAVGPGTDGQVLTSTGAGSPPAFEDASSTTINNNADNRVITGSGTANTLEGEANLTFDGSGSTSSLTINNSASSGDAFLYVKSGEGGGACLELWGDEGDDNSDIWRVQNAGADEIEFRSKTSGSYVQKFKIAGGGNATITDGDLVIGTAGHGIDFSAQSASGTQVSEVLDHYEEGTWSPTFANLANATLNTNTNGEYIRIGSLVYIRCWVGLSSITGGQSWTLAVGGFPFTANSGGYGRYPLAINAYGLSFSSDRQAIYASMGESGTTAEIASTNGTTPNVSTSEVTANNCTGSTSFYLCGSYHVLGY